MTLTGLSIKDIYRDLATNARFRAEIDKAAAKLSLDDFASRYGSAIRSHYGKKDGYDLDPEEGYELAVRLWHWLEEHR